MADAEHVAKLYEGVDSWCAWRDANPETVPDLSDLDMEGFDLVGIDLRRANLHDSRLDEANLREADLSDADLSNATLRRAKLSDAILKSANLQGSNLNRADLFRVKMPHADLRNAKLKRVNVVEADLSNTKLSKANLSEADFFVVELVGADLSETILDHANFFVTNLSKTSMRDARLWGVAFHESLFAEADLTNASLWLTRLIRCDLSRAIVENTVVRDLRIHEIRGCPLPPSILRLDENGDSVLFGYEAHRFFEQPAYVEIQLSLHLSDLELACYQLHVVNLHKKNAATNAHFAGQRKEGSNTILCFQAPHYENIYRVLPDLLAPFPRSQAIDWQGTLAAVAESDKENIPSGWVSAEHEDPLTKWPFAERLAASFLNYRNAFVSTIRHAGYGPHIRFSVIQDHLRSNLVMPGGLSEGEQSFLVVPLNEKVDITISQQNVLDRFQRHG